MHACMHIGRLFKVRVSDGLIAVSENAWPVAANGMPAGACWIVDDSPAETIGTAMTALHFQPVALRGADQFVFVSLVAIQMPANTATSPIRRFGVIGSPISSAASKVAAIGLTVMVLATRVGVARASAMTQRMKASAPPPAPR